MTDFFYRTEDIRPDEIGNYFVSTAKDRALIDALKNRNPTIVVGSRGVGKSFLLRVAENELLNELETTGVLPVYITFVRSSLLHTSDRQQFKHWMLARITSAIVRALKKTGRMLALPNQAGALAPTRDELETRSSKVEEIISAYENSWKNPDESVDISALPSVEDLKETLEDLARAAAIERFDLLFDEAAHIFVPEQQRQFFTLFRDLRSPYITCNAAVYPGVTNYGDTFQPAHDATMLSIDRDILSNDYVENMREIVARQADSNMLKSIAQNANSFAVLAYAATGNPRQLLKTVSQAPSIRSGQINEVVREFYRVEIWAEHTALSDKYTGHRSVIDWGRSFLENSALPEIKGKNEHYLENDKNSSAYIWIHRDVPAAAKEALRVLCYTGLLTEHGTGIRASRSEIGTRYMVNLGCLFALEASPSSVANEIASNLTPKRMTEYGHSHPLFTEVVESVSANLNEPVQLALKEQFERAVEVLDLTEWQKMKLKELNLLTVGEVFNASDEKLKEAFYVGDVRARRMRNAADAAVLEYLSG